MINVEKVKPTGIFTNYIYKAIPLAFDESMSYYECLCGLLNYLKNTVMPALNNNADAIIELQTLCSDLKNYVDNYFNNLDVQEEINNKLDEMADNGELTDIIAQYLGLAGVLAYNNVNELANAENIVNGSITKTLGFYNYNDGGGAYYKIRTITNEDTIDGVNIIAIINDNSLIAELIPTSKMSVKCYGAYGDGTHDDTTALQNAINNHSFGTLYFDEGTYLISSPLETSATNNATCNFELEHHTIIKSNEEIECLFDFGGSGGNGEGVVYRQKWIKGGVLNANNCLYGIKINNYYSGLYVQELEINNFTTAGIYIPEGNGSSILTVKNCYINGKSSAQNCTGIILNRADNVIVDTNINACQKCITASMGGQIIRHVHGLGIGYTDNNDWFTGTVFFEMSGGDSNIIDECFCDTHQTFIKSTLNNNFGSFELINSIYFSYINNVQSKIIDLAGRDTKYIIKNNQFTIPSASSNNQGLVIFNYNSQISSKSNSNYVGDNLIKNPTNLVGGDLLLSSNKQYSPYWNQGGNNISTTQWVKVGYIVPNGFTNYNFRFDFQKYTFSPSVRLDKVNSNTTLYLTDDTKSNSNKEIKIGVKSVGTVSGADMYALYIKAVSADIPACIQVKQSNENLPFVMLNTNLMDIAYEDLTMDSEITI